MVRKIADFFYIHAQGCEYEAKPRGSLKKEKQNIIVGDCVDFSVLDQEEKKSVIERVYPRKNCLIRPSVANVTRMILLFSVQDPKINTAVIDNFLVIAEKNKLDVTLAFGKIDLDETQSYKKIVEIYRKIGYDTVEISAKDQVGIETIKTKIRGSITVIAGPSGVGKSSLINALSKNFNQNTSKISEKLQKGKNTTTYASLLEMNKDSYVADTPGFTFIKVTDVELDELKNYFIEFAQYAKECKYGSKCKHQHEPDCGVKNAVTRGEIPAFRYASYVRLLGEIEKKGKRRKYK